MTPLLDSHRKGRTRRRLPAHKSKQLPLSPQDARIIADLSVEGLGIESLSRDRLAGAIARRLVDHFNRMPTKE